jgi:hypothetical protein
LNLEVPERKLLSLVFFGLPEIEDNLLLDPPLAQRVAIKFRLAHLTPESTEAYIKHRLRLAGASRMPFTAEAVNAVHRFSSGTPRVINTLCDNALFEGYVARVPMIEEAMIGRVAGDLGLTSGAAVNDDKAGRANGGHHDDMVSPPRYAAPKEQKPLDLGEIDRYLAGLAKPS